VEIAKLEDQMNAPNFWDDNNRAQKVTQELSLLKDEVQAFQQLLSQQEDLHTLLDLALEEEDQETAQEVEAGINFLQEELEKWELRLLLSGEYDSSNAFVAIHAGAGGTESQDWVEMLLRMYTRWLDKSGYQVEVTDILPGDEAGIKSVTLLAKGPNAYGYLKAEKGVHRLVRISPFDASGRRHTSFASVDILPEIDDDKDIGIKPEDIKMETCRSGGAGGQHVNKTESAVRIIHLPTGIIVQCRSERSQHNNRALALRMLKAKLVERELEAQREKLSQLRGDQQEIAWGSQIRSYVFHPYNLVKDHRTSYETGNVHAVMDGELTPFIEAYLRHALKKQES